MSIDSLSEVSIKWNGSAIAQTVGNVTRTWDGNLVINPANVTPAEVAMWESYSMQVGDPIVAPIEGSFRLQCVTSTTSSAHAAMRDIADDWRLLGLRYNPFDGPVALEVTRKNSAGSSIVTTLTAQASALPAPKLVAEGGIDEGIWLTGVASQIRAFYVVRFRAAYGLWRSSSAETGTGTATTGGVTLATSNSGVRDVPARLDIGTVTGSPTTAILYLSGVPYLQITNPTTGQFYDFTTPGEYTGDATVSAAYGDLRIPAGSTSWTWQVTGGTGTVPATLTWYPEFGSW